MAARGIIRALVCSSQRLQCLGMIQPRILSAFQSSSQCTSPLTFGRSFSVNTPLRESEKTTSDREDNGEENRGEKTSLRGTPYVQIDPETSIRYMESNAYYQTYGNDPVWLHFRRNFKGQFLPKKTRKKCVRAQKYSTGNPCPVCRDNYLVPYYKNVKLLKQFISPYSGQVLHYNETNVCQHQHNNILVAVEQAWDYGLIDMPFPRRKYDYSHYYGDLMKEKSENVASEK